jgi:hypothetical protein
MLAIIKPNDDTCWLAQDRHIVESHSEALYDFLEFYPDGWFTPERDSITLPSTLAPGEIDHLSQINFND